MSNPAFSLIVSWLLAAQSPLAAGQTDRWPVPDPGRVKHSGGLLREVFKEQYAKTDPDQRRSLAELLFKTALETHDDLCTRYVLLRESAALASRASDIPVGITALDQLGQEYQVDALSLKAAYLAEVAKTARSPADFKQLAEANLRVLQQAMAAENLELAESASSSAMAAVKKSNDLGLLDRTEARCHEVVAARAEADLLRKSRETLQKDPENGPANLVVGRLECFVRHDWKAGLSFLAKSGDPVLSGLARRDLDGPGTGPEQVSLGDAWWNQADQEAGAARVNLRKRAAYWYERALKALSGLSKARAEKRIALARGEERSPGLVGLWSFEESSGTVASDGSGNGQTAALSPGASWGEGISGGGLRLDGTGGHALVASCPVLNLDTDSFTVACWVRPEGTNPYRVVNKWDLDGKLGWMLDIHSRTGGNSDVATRLGRLRTRIGDGTGNIDFTVDPHLVPGEWRHIALVLDRTGREARLYADGKQVGSGSRFEALGSVSTKVPLAIGLIPPSTGGFYCGMIDDLRIYRRVLSDPELRDLAARK